MQVLQTVETLLSIGQLLDPLLELVPQQQLPSYKLYALEEQLVILLPNKLSHLPQH